MIEVLKNSSLSITIEDISFSIASYKISHSVNNSKQFTVSGGTYIFSKGINPLIISMKSCSEFSDSSAVTALETALSSSSACTFSADGILFQNMILQEYSAEKDKSGFIRNIDMVFITSSSVSAIAEDETYE